MKHKKIKLSVLLLSIGITAQAQESVNSSGGGASGPGGSIAYSIGQLFYSTHTGNTGSLAQGVQHAYEIFTAGVKETTLDISLNVFPNPTTDNLTLQISNYSNERFTYQLYDMQGKLLSNGDVVSQRTQINTASLPSATYFINIVNQENNRVQSFKIIKN